MFTGIVTDVGEVTAVRETATGLKRLTVACRYDRASIADGASIACNGVCLTVVAAGTDGGRTWFAADAAAETLAVTTAANWCRGTRLNLERALRLGDELSGHLVAGHVDGVAAVAAREDLAGAEGQGRMVRFAFTAPPRLARFVAAKGSLALDGVSLTVNAVTGNRFEALVIPHTLQVTTFAALRSGDHVNVEVDLMARYAARLMESQPDP